MNRKIFLKGALTSLVVVAILLTAAVGFAEDYEAEVARHIKSIKLYLGNTVTYNNRGEYYEALGAKAKELGYKG